MSNIGTPRDLVNDYVKKIADVVAGEEAQAYTGNQYFLRHSLDRIGDHFIEKPLAKQVSNQAASTADSVAGVVADLNSLLSALKDAGVMTPDVFTLTFASVDDTFAGHSDRQYNTNKISSVAVSKNVITITLSEKVSALKDFAAGGNWGTHKWLGIGISAGVSPITNLYYNGTQLGAEDVAEATECSLSAGYFVRWVAADLVLANDNTQASKNYFKIWASGYAETEYTLKIVEPS